MGTALFTSSLDFDNRYYGNLMHLLTQPSAMVNYFKQFSLIFDISFDNDYHLPSCQEKQAVHSWSVAENIRALKTLLGEVCFYAENASVTKETYSFWDAHMHDSHSQELCECIQSRIGLKVSTFTKHWSHTEVLFENDTFFDLLRLTFALQKQKILPQPHHLHLKKQKRWYEHKKIHKI